MKQRAVVLSNIKENFSPDWQTVGLAGLLLFALAFCYARVFVTLAHLWWTNDVYSYGFLIPWISLYLVWVQREKLRRIEPVPNYLGGFLLFMGGLLMLVVGQASGIALIEELSLIVTLMGSVLLLLGKESLHLLWFPIVYLFFMIPVWGALTEPLHLPFQLFSANVGTQLLRFIGIPVHRNGIYIELPNITLEVADVCSGVNYLIAVIAIGIPMAYLFLVGWWKRAALLVFSVIVAAFSNVLRVALIGALSYYGIGGDLHGPFHVLQGLSVSLIGYGAIFAGVWILSKPAAPSALSAKVFNPQKPSGLVLKKNEPTYPGLFLSAVLLLIGSYLHLYQQSSVPLKAPLKDFPVQLGEWLGKQTSPDYSFYRAFGVDEELSRSYQTSTGDSLRLYIGYYTSQDREKKLINYKISELHRKAEKIRIGVDDNHLIEVNRVIEDGNPKKLTLFWYYLYGRDVADWYQAKKETMIGSLLQARTHGAIVMVTADFSHPEDLLKQSVQSQSFIKVIRPLLPEFLPQ